MYDVVIIGGGASGLAAGITAKARGMSVLILESADRVGKKLLATGNGKCNISNTGIKAENYNNLFAEKFLTKQDKFFRFFDELGLKLKKVEDRIYPYSDSAATVLNLLRSKFTDDEIVTGCKVEKVAKQGELFIINDNFMAKNVILATGSNATMGHNSHFLAESFGHKASKLKPAIVPLITDTYFIKRLENLRAKVEVSLIKDGNKVYSRNGEILFKDNGLSGIAVFMLSSYLARNEGNYDVAIDFAPDLTLEETEAFLAKNTIFGLLQKAIAESVVFQAQKLGNKLGYTVKNFIVQNARLGSIKNAQVTCGGLNTDDFDENLQSKLAKNLYACGEVLDVDGDCGGYNLYWAFISGITAGESVC
ncbi:MAG TPA: aminoacetone oxidase family FAD-binding enzyme [Clostridia bacterium]|nr:aminoacetone oxidase family FAD-binding enzyme [Clostridia bacterium]